MAKSPIDGMNLRVWSWLWPVTLTIHHLGIVKRAQRYQINPVWWPIMLVGHLTGWAFGLLSIPRAPDLIVASWSVNWLDVVALSFYLVVRFFWRFPGATRLLNIGITGQMIFWTVQLILSGFILSRVVLLIRAFLLS